MTTPLDPTIQYGPQLPGQPPAWIVANGIRYILSPPGIFGAPSNFVTPSRADPHTEQVRITNLPKGPETPKSQGLFGSYPLEPEKHGGMPRAEVPKTQGLFSSYPLEPEKHSGIPRTEARKGHGLFG
jgi:hypothetical protein